jgi:hypothetical protein
MREIHIPLATPCSRKIADTALRAVVRLGP